MGLIQLSVNQAQMLTRSIDLGHWQTYVIYHGGHSLFLSIIKSLVYLIPSFFSLLSYFKTR